MVRMFSAALAAVVFWMGAAAPTQALSGDAEALAMARRMVEQLGGRETWSRARWVYAREEAWFANRAGPADVEFWRRADGPGQWHRAQGPDWSRAHAWTGSSGWRQRDGVTSDFTTQDLQFVHGWRRGEVYLMYVWLAQERDDLRVQKTGERSFRVLAVQDGANLGEFQVDHAGAPARWRFGFGEDSVDYIYGPLKQFGPIRMPAWGALNDGTFRFFYTDVRLSEADPAVSFDRPN